MIKMLRSLFDSDAQAEATYSLDEQLRLASVVLLVEMMYQDDQVLDEEIQAVKSVIKSHFGLQASQADALFQAACEKAQLATDSHEFTSLIAKHYSMEQKIQLIEFLWSVAFADNHLDAHEEHLVRRIADLIYVPHNEFIKAKHRALENQKAN